MRRLPRLICILLVLALLAGCAAGEPEHPEPPERPVTLWLWSELPLSAALAALAEDYNAAAPVHPLRLRVFDSEDQMADAILDLQQEIPKEIDWAIQIDGHTDPRPIASSQFPSNWELSTARAASVVKYMISKGVPAERLVAAGYGEFRPIEGGTSEEANQKNRRIELKLTNR